MKDNGKCESKCGAVTNELINTEALRTRNEEGKTYYPAIPTNARATSRHLAASKAPATAASNQTARKAPVVNGLDEEDRLGMRRARKVVRWTVITLDYIE